MLNNNVSPIAIRSIQHFSPEFFIYSFAVSLDGHRALIYGAGEDTEFPQLWVFDDRADNEGRGECAARIDRDLLIDSPSGKVFWAENQKDIAFSFFGDEQVYEAEFDWESKRMSVVRAVKTTPYHLGRIQNLVDFSGMPEPLKAPVGVALDGAEKPLAYKACLESFVENLAEEMLRDRDFAIRFGMADGPEDWRKVAKVYRTCLVALSRSTRDHGIALPDLYQYVTPFELESFHPEVGRKYRVSWGSFVRNGEYKQWHADIRADGPSPREWVTLPNKEPIDVDLVDRPVLWGAEME